MARTVPPLPDCERRQHSRHEVFAQVQVSSAGEIYVLACRNLSMGGAYLEGRLEDCPEMHVGAPIDVAIFREDGAPAREVQAGARVVRIDPGAPGRPPGFGVVLERIEPADRQRLEEMIAGR